MDGGHRWEQVLGAPLPERYARVPVVLFAQGNAWIATEGGEVFMARAVQTGWSLVTHLPADIYAAAAGGSPSSISSGHR